jgi:hypothetical protein
VIAHGTALPKIQLDQPVLHARGRSQQFRDAVTISRAGRVVITVRVRNADPVRRVGVRVSLRRYGAGPMLSASVVVGALRAGGARTVSFDTVAPAPGNHVFWVLRAGSKLGANYRNGSTDVVRIISG